MKRLLALLLAVIALLGLCACGEEADDTQQPTTTATYGTPPPEDVGSVAETFIAAYCQADRHTYYPLYCYDHRGAELAKILEGGQTEAAFCAEAEKQLKENHGVDMSIKSFDDFLSAKYEMDKRNKKNLYGAYTVTAEAVDSAKLTTDKVAEFRSALLGRWDEKCFDLDVFNAITDGYTVTVNVVIDGEKKDLRERYLVHLVPYKGEWRIISHSE